MRRTPLYGFWTHTSNSVLLAVIPSGPGRAQHQRAARLHLLECGVDPDACDRGGLYGIDHNFNNERGSYYWETTNHAGQKVVHTLSYWVEDSGTLAHLREVYDGTSALDEICTYYGFDDEQRLAFTRFLFRHWQCYINDFNGMIVKVAEWPASPTHREGYVAPGCTFPRED